MTMIRKYLGIMAILILVLAGGIVYLGWHTAPIKNMVPAHTSAPSYGPSPESSATQQAQQDSGAPTAQATTQVEPVRPFDMESATWAEYQTTSAGGQPAESTVKLEYGPGVSGSTQELFRRTVTSGTSSYTSSAVPGITYGVQVYSTQSSSTSSSTMTLSQAQQDDPIMSSDNIMGTPVDSGSITVPKGTFDCEVYAGDFDGADSTYWAAAGVPVPVPVYTACDGTTYELVDWG